MIGTRPRPSPARAAPPDAPPLPARKATVTLLVPTLNEIVGMKAVMPLVRREWFDQVLILDGGSTDGTIEWARAAGFEVHVQTEPGIRRGYLEVLPKITGDIVLTFSPDGNSLPELLPQLIAKMDEGYDMVIASRYKWPARSEDDDLVTAFGNWLFTRTVNLLNGGRYTDAMVIYRAFRKRLVQDLELDQDRWFRTPERLFRCRISWEPLLSARAAPAACASRKSPATSRRGLAESASSASSAGAPPTTSNSCATSCSGGNANAEGPGTMPPNEPQPPAEEAGPKPLWKRDVAFAVALAVLIAAAYSPSLKHAPRSDQWAYLVNTMDCGTFAERLRASYSYNRTRADAAGDTELFRPVLFALLAMEAEIFGSDFRLPQLVGVALHVTVSLLLLVLLRQMNGDGDPLSYAVTAFFALNPCVQELVIWTHLHGYLLFLVFVLASLALLIRYVNNPRSVGRWWSPTLWGAWALALLSAFTYELGQVYAVFVGLFLAAAVHTKAGTRRGIGLFMAFSAILPIYQADNALDRWARVGREGTDANARIMLDRMFTPMTLTNAGRFVTYTAAQPFFPALVKPRFSGEAGRMYIAESLWHGDGCRAFTPALVASYAAAGLALWLGLLGVRRMVRAEVRLPCLVFCFAAALFATYTASNVFGRLNVRTQPSALTGNCYYAYTGLLFALVALNAAWRSAGHCPTLRGGLTVGLIALSATGRGHGASDERRHRP